jgi:L-serine dehydratase
MARPTNILEVIPSPPQGSRPPSIFNDVIGPVMRGPSSSHCAAAVRIGRMARDLMAGQLRSALVEFHPSGSLATTHRSQGSDMGLFGGLLGWDATDDRLVDSEDAIRAAGVEIEIRITDYPAAHPNTYRMTLDGPAGRHTMTAISTGGGMVEIQEVDGVKLSMVGDFHETLAWAEEGHLTDAAAEGLERELRTVPSVEEVFVHRASSGWLIQAKGRGPLGEAALERVRGDPGVREVRSISPVLPTLSRSGLTVPFLSAKELLGHNRDRKLDLWELAVEYEAARGGTGPAEVFGEMGRIVDLLQASVLQGMGGTEYSDRILGPQAGSFRDRLKEGRLLPGGILDTVIPYVTALMEVKSAMGVIVAAPTAGACGALPGACIGAGHALGMDREALVRGMLAAGIIGIFISARSTFAAEVCGCQAECGAGSGMAAAALVTLMGGTTQEALSASSMALQNTLGMICDPVANRVEVPCLGRNVLAATNAFACANMALAGFDAVIPLDEVIDTMDSVGKSLPHQLRCTALGGLSVTPTSQRLQRDLDAGDA